MSKSYQPKKSPSNTSSFFSSRSFLIYIIRYGFFEIIASKAYRGPIVAIYTLSVLFSTKI